MQPDSNLNINAVEGFPLDAFSADVSFARPCPSSCPGNKHEMKIRAVNTYNGTTN